MRTKLLNVFAILAMLVCSLSTSAHDFEVDGIYYNITDKKNKTVEVTFKGYSYEYSNCYSGKLIIPSLVTYDGVDYCVTGIGDKAFQSDALSSLTIPSTITSLGYIIIRNHYKQNTLTEIIVEDGNPKYDSRGNCNAIIETETNTLLYGCNNTIIPEDIINLANSAFLNCSELTNISLTDNITTIGQSTFEGCTKIESIRIPKNLTDIGYSAFEGCINLKSVYITNLSAWCNINFSNRTANPLCNQASLYLNGELVRELIIPNDIKEIKNYTFNGCSPITKVAIPQNVISIGDDVFGGCPTLAAIVVEKGNTVYDSRNNCNAVIETATRTLITGCKNTIIPNDIVQIGDYAFSGCSELTNIVIPENVTNIGQGAFLSCTSLTDITIPKNVVSIGDIAFSNCTNLMEVTSLSEIAPTLGRDVFDDNGEAILNYPENSDYIKWGQYFYNFEHYENGGSYWVVDDFGNAIVRPVEYSQEPLTNYRGEKELKRVYVDEGFTAVGQDAFRGCSSLKEIYLHEGITTISDGAFENCSSLREIYLHEGITSIGYHAFLGAPIEFLVIPTTVMSIGEGAFSEYFNEQEEYTYPTLVFKTFTPPMIEGYLYAEICIPESANSYPLDKFGGSISYFDPREEFVYNQTTEKMFVFGNISEVSDDRELCYDKRFKDVENIVFTPNAVGYEQIRTLNNIKNIEVQSKPNMEQGDICTIKGSNAILGIDWWSSELTLLAGCSSTIIPDGVSCIGGSAFWGCTGLDSIKIPNSVSNINGQAFMGCTGLESIEIPNSVVWSNAFEGCVGLQEVVVGGGELRPYSFSGCTNLKELTIGARVSNISGEAFHGCTDLANISIDERNTIYDCRDNCGAIIESATNKLVFASKESSIPSSVVSIGEYAFNIRFDEITIPSTITEIEANAFCDVNKLYFSSEIPATIAKEAFNCGAIYVPVSAYDTYCNADVWSQYKDRIVTQELAEKEVEVWSTEGMSGILNEVGLNEADKVVKLKVKGEINSYDMIVMRDKMPLLQEIDLSEATVVASSKPFYQTFCTGKNSLGSHAFYDLDKLVSVKLPKDLTTLGDYAFYGCERLKSVDASVTEGLYIGEGTFSSCSDLQEFVAPLVISEIGSTSFNGCRSLKELDIHRITGTINRSIFGASGIERLYIDSIGGDISSNAFSGCSSLQELKVGTLVGSLGDNAFNGCRELRNVEFTRGPQKVGSRMFTLADKLENFVVGEGVAEISDNAFYAYEEVYEYGQWGWVSKVVEIDRTALKRVVLPEGLQKIGSKAFHRCISLSDFSLPQGVTSIGTSAFEGCTSLKSMEVPNTLTSLADKTFSGCSSLENVTLPDGLSTIGSKAFYDCSSLTDIVLPHSLTTIASSTFSGCGLKNVTFPDGLKSIGASAFSGCDFETLKLPPMLRTIDKSAFNGCELLKELHIPSSVEYIGDNAFTECNKLNAVYTYTVEPTEITETTFSTFASATLYVPATSFWNYYWDIGWSRFNHKNFKDFNEKYDYFYLNNDYYLNGSTGYIEGTPDVDLRPGAGLIVEADKDNEDGKQNLGDVSVDADGNGNSASIIGDDNLSIENLHVKINVKGGRWYFFAFPWDVPLHKISMQNSSDYVFRYYDGEERAKYGHGGWKDVNESHLKAARGYIFQCSADDVLLISIEDVKFKKADKFNELVTHSSQNLNDASWNLMGNPYLSYYDLAAMDYTAPVTVWDGTKYVAIRPGDDDYQFAPYEAFFVQKPENEESVGFSVDAQMTRIQSTTFAAQKAAARRTRSIDPQRQLINLVLSYDETSDRTRVVFNDRQSNNYEVSCDAAKFQSEGVAQIYTLDGEGVRYAINERPVGNGVVQIGYTATENGYYTIEAARMDATVYLYDAETKIMHNLDEGSYTFFSGKGTFEKRFTLGMPKSETTDMEKIGTNAAMIEVVEGGILFKANATATVYNAAGMVVAVQQGVGLVQLPAGTYVVNIGESNTKVVVK